MSDYVQEFVDSVSIPTSEEIVKAYTSQIDKELKIHKDKMTNFF